MNQDGTNRKQLTGAVRQNVDPTVSPDGRYIVYTSAQPNSVDLWRMDIDGGNAVQLTHNLYALNASFSPDGRWVVFASAAQSGQKHGAVPVVHAVRAAGPVVVDGVTLRERSRSGRDSQVERSVSRQAFSSRVGTDRLAAKSVTSTTPPLPSVRIVRSTAVFGR